MSQYVTYTVKLKKKYVSELKDNQTGSFYYIAER